MLAIFFCFTCTELKQTPFPFSVFLIGVQSSYLAQWLKHLFHLLLLTNHAWWTWFFLISCVEAWLFLLQWRFISLPNILMNSSRCIIVSLFVFSIKVIQISAIRSTETCKLTFIIVVIIMLFQRGVQIFAYERSLGLYFCLSFSIDISNFADVLLK